MGRSVWNGARPFFPRHCRCCSEQSGHRGNRADTADSGERVPQPVVASACMSTPAQVGGRRGLGRVCSFTCHPPWRLKVCFPLWARTESGRRGQHHIWGSPVWTLQRARGCVAPTHHGERWNLVFDVQDISLNVREIRVMAGGNLSIGSETFRLYSRINIPFFGWCCRRQQPHRHLEGAARSGHSRCAR